MRSKKPTCRSIPRSSAAVEFLENRLLFVRALGIDISDFQGTLSAANWTSIKNSGKSFVFTKATEGVTFDASTFANNITRAKTAGMLAGAYHFGRPDNNTAVAEAQHFISVISPYLTAGYLRPVLDIEVDAGNVSFMSTWVNAFCNYVKTNTGFSPIIYTGQSFASSNFDSSVTQWPNWIAQWPGSPNPETQSPAGTSPWAGWNFWQYSATGTVPGISGAVDLDVYNGDLAALTNNFVIKAPDVTVLRGVTTIADGQVSPVDFGTINVGASPVSISFTVRNDGQQALSLSGLSVPAGYTVVDGLATSLLAGASDTLTVRLDSAVAGVKSGQIQFNTNDPTATPFNFAITGTVSNPDTVAPVVSTGIFAYSSTPHQVGLFFSENVGPSFSAADVVVVNTTTGLPVTPASVTFNTVANLATVDFGTTLADGNHTLVILAPGVADLAGNPMAANYQLDFFFLQGDANHDRSVDLTDFSTLAANFGMTSGATFAGGDFSYNGGIDLTDFSILASQFGKTLPSMRVAGVGSQSTAPVAGPGLFSSVALDRRTEILGPVEDDFLPACAFSRK